ncbi:MAG: alpha/beta hydrolase [Sedimenticola selenatireducens]|uniref:Alpha/beta hydrolase n=2 Tax=Sedimenticola selenatireducens TaxID=191960 RepID=A0A557SDV5_9GAMM|nr:alpha/beta hydrolase [Sedimenticola selenatireducens]TVT65480.1 MAG: alpha/beta hydrolase [Sedimenticola selenatireducens]
MHRRNECDKILLVHGIWMTGIEMSRLRWYLSGHGFDVETFSYHSLRRTPEENAEQLQQFIKRRQYECVHLVAHSLGGIVLLNLFDRYPDQPPGRVVLLGAPVQGSMVARRLFAHPLTRWLIGKAGVRGLIEGAPPWRGQRELGVIAGTSGVGMGRLVGGLYGESDGTVMVSETQIPAAVASHSHSVGHMGMLFSARVASDVAGFLKTGHFSEQQA